MKFLCIDVGGTSIKSAILDDDFRIFARNEVATQAFLGGKSVLKKVVSIVAERQKSEKLAGVCISTCGMVDPTSGEIFFANDLMPSYAGTNYKAEIERAFSIPCEVENDVNCAALAEWQSGAAKGCDPALVLTVGTGIGGCLVAGGKVFHGFSNSAFEVGYIQIDGKSFESQGATSVLSAKVAAKKGGTSAEWNGRRIFLEAKQGDKICLDAIDEMAAVLGKGIATLCYTANPEVVVLGGGIMAERDFLRPRIQKAIDGNLISAIAKKTRLEFAFHENDAGMTGALANFLGKHPDNEHSA